MPDFVLDEYLQIIVVWQNPVGIGAVWLVPVLPPHTRDAPYIALCENTTPSTKPEVHNISQC